MNTFSSFSHKSNEPESSVLYVVGTPIGNMNDLSYRALNILKNVSLIACEDTRQTKKIMYKFEFNNNLLSFNNHNSLNKIPKIINYLNSGKSIALVSDAGMPGISDPGEDLVKIARTNGIKVICIPGPSAALTAIVSSGLPSSRFTFEGFLPRKNSERAKILSQISKSDKTTILFEAPNRLKKLLNELKDFCGEEREIAVSRELTKKFEETIGNNIYEVIDYFDKKEVLGEITILVKGISKKNYLFEFNKNELKSELNYLINAGLSLSNASKYLAKKTSLPKSTIYNIYKD